MKKVCFVIAATLLLLTACGKQGKIVLNNGTGRTLDSVALTVGDSTQTWTNISPDEVFHSNLPVPEGEAPVNLAWSGGGFRNDIDTRLIDRAQEAKRISVFFAMDELSVGYEF